MATLWMDVVMVCQRFRQFTVPVRRKLGLAGRYTDIEHDVVVLENQAPCLAAASFFTLGDANLADDLVGVAINVMPVSETKTVTVLSYTAQTGKLAHAALDRILGSTGDYQKYELSKLIISRISNFLIAPRHFRAWGQEKADRIREAFTRTVIAQREVDEHADLMLFLGGMKQTGRDNLRDTIPILDLYRRACRQHRLGGSTITQLISPLFVYSASSGLTPCARVECDVLQNSPDQGSTRTLVPTSRSPVRFASQRQGD